MDYTHLPPWVIRVIKQVFLTLRQNGVYYFHVDNPILELDREEDDIFCVRLQNRVKISCLLPSGQVAKVPIHHKRNRCPLVVIEKLDLVLNRFILTIRLP